MRSWLWVHGGSEGDGTVPELKSQVDRDAGSWEGWESVGFQCEPDPSPDPIQVLEVLHHLGIGGRIGS